MKHKLTYTFHLTTEQLVKRWALAGRLSYAKSISGQHNSAEQKLYSEINDACFFEHAARFNVIRSNRERIGNDYDEPGSPYQLWKADTNDFKGSYKRENYETLAACG